MRYNRAASLAMATISASLAASVYSQHRRLQVPVTKDPPESMSMQLISNGKTARTKSFCVPTAGTYHVRILSEAGAHLKSVDDKSKSAAFVFEDGRLIASGPSLVGNEHATDIDRFPSAGPEFKGDIGHRYTVLLRAASHPAWDNGTCTAVISLDELDLEGILARNSFAIARYQSLAIGQAVTIGFCIFAVIIFAYVGLAPRKRTLN